MKLYPVLVYESGVLQDVIVQTSEAKAKKFAKEQTGEFAVGKRAHPLSVTRDAPGLIAAIGHGVALAAMQTPEALDLFNETLRSAEEQLWDL